MIATAKSLESRFFSPNLSPHHCKLRIETLASSLLLLARGGIFASLHPFTSLRRGARTQHKQTNTMKYLKIALVAAAALFAAASCCPPTASAPAPVYQAPAK